MTFRNSTWKFSYPFSKKDFYTLNLCFQQFSIKLKFEFDKTTNC